MPNWCYTTYTVVGDEKEVEQLHGLMEKLENMKKSLVDNGFGPNWLGNLVHSLGGDWQKVYCRGTWSNLDISGDTLYFDVESAWAEPDEVIDFLRSKYPSLVFYYQADEPGTRYFVTNDAEGSYYDDIYYFAEPMHNDEHFYRAGKEDKFLEDVGAYIGKKLKSIDEVYDAVDQYNDDKDWEDYIEVKIYKVVS